MKLIGDITHHQESIQEQRLQALKNILAKRKRRIEKEEKSKAEGQLECAASEPWPTENVSVKIMRLVAVFSSVWQYEGLRGVDQTGRNLFSQCAQIASPGKLSKT